MSDKQILKCPNDECQNHRVPSDKFMRDGTRSYEGKKISHIRQRYKCGLCGKRFQPKAQAANSQRKRENN